MSSQKIIGAILIVLFSAISALMIRSGMTSPKVEAKAPQQRIRVVTADLPAGSLIQIGDLAWRTIPGSASDDQFAESENSEDKILGSVVRLPLTKGQPVERSRIVLPDAPGFLAAALAPGKRAVSVAINDVSGNAGLIRPGDRVDIILTQHIKGDGGFGSDVVGETVLSNIRVIAVGHQLYIEKADSKANGSARTLTFEVDGQQAERITVATQLGDLSLALRSLASELGHIRQADGSVVPLATEAFERPQPVHAADVSDVVLRQQPPTPEAIPAPAYVPVTVKVYRGAEKSE